MMKNLMATTTLAVLMSTAALAQSAQDEAAGGPIFSNDGQSVIEDIEGFFEADDSWILATSLIGETVYTGASDDDETVGEIRDIVMSPNGGAEAVVIGVGGFLGMGEKEVAVDFELISRSMDANGDVWLVVAADREQLEAAPEFDREVVRGQEDGEATADPQAADGDVAVAPATDDTQENVMDTDPDAERTLVPIDSATLSADQITGLDVWGADEESIGSVSDVLVDPEGGVDAFVVDVGGFLGLGAKPVAIGAENLQAVVEGEEWEAIQTSFTQEQLEAHVEYSEQAYQDGDEAVVLRATAN